MTAKDGEGRDTSIDVLIAPCALAVFVIYGRLFRAAQGHYFIICRASVVEEDYRQDETTKRRDNKIKCRTARQQDNKTTLSILLPLDL